MVSVRGLREPLTQLYESTRRSGFTIYHVLKTLELIDRERALGRILLSRLLGIGEGSARNLFRKLRDSGLVVVDPVAGGVLTEEGRLLLERWREAVTSYCIEGSDLVPWRYVAIHRVSEEIGTEILGRRGVVGLRDEIVRRGCVGGLIIRTTGGRPMLLDTLGRPDYDISETDLGRRVSSMCRGGLCIVTGSEKSCLEAESCLWSIIAETIIGSGQS